MKADYYGGKEIVDSDPAIPHRMTWRITPTLGTRKAHEREADEAYSCYDGGIGRWQ